MKRSGDRLFTPVYLKLDDADPWPSDEVFYLVTADGLFLGRNHPFFTSCVPADAYPTELAAQRPFLRLSYPKLARRTFERVIGFFDIVARRHASEAAVLLVWNPLNRQVEVIAPDQVGLVGATWQGEPYPMEVEYEVPSLAPHLRLIGDIHSHVHGPAYASSKDRADEAHRPGIHLVVGRIHDEPPEFHCEVVADGVRFRVRDLQAVVAGYERRRLAEVPADWLDRFAVKAWMPAPVYARAESGSDPRDDGGELPLEVGEQPKASAS